MTSLKLRIQADLNAARKSRDKLRTRVLSTVLSEIKNKEIDTREELDESAEGSVLTRAIKQRRDASEQMRGAGRTELADGEDAEAAILVGYLPPQLGEGEVRALIREAVASGAENMGAVMGSVMPQLRGRFDGKEANRLVREELGQ